MFVDDNPAASLDDVLVHYGVKGMKWGVRKAVLNGMNRSGFTKAAQKNAANAKRRTAVGVAVGSTVGGGSLRRKVHDFNHKPDISGVTRKDARHLVKIQNRNMNRKLQDLHSDPNRSRIIRTARANQVAAHRRYQDVRDEIKQQKGKAVIGKHAARVALNHAKNERYTVVHTANQTTMGEQFMQALFSQSTHH
jgi:hypothetical protein